MTEEYRFAVSHGAAGHSVREMVSFGFLTVSWTSRWLSAQQQLNTCLCDYFLCVCPAFCRLLRAGPCLSRSLHPAPLLRSPRPEVRKYWSSEGGQVCLLDWRSSTSGRVEIQHSLGDRTPGVSHGFSRFQLWDSEHLI